MSKQMKSVTLDPKLVEAINEERRRSLKSFSAILSEWATKGKRRRPRCPHGVEDWRECEPCCMSDDVAVVVPG